MKRRITFFLFYFLASCFWFPLSGYAACTSPAGADGNLMYNGDAHIPQYCNGVSWVVMAPTINLPATNGLVGYWKLDDGSGASAMDSTGNGYTGTLYNAPTWTSGYYNGALNFNNATTNYVDLGNAAGLQLTTGTVSAWINTVNAGSGYRGIVIKQFAYGLLLNGGSLSLYDWGSGNERATGVNLADGKWHHVAATLQSGVTDGTIVYIDGVASMTTTITVSNQGTGAVIGSGSDPQNGQNYGGLIDDVRIYNRVLSAAEVTTLYNYHISPPSSSLVGYWKFDESAGTVAADSSGNANNGAATGTTIVAGQIGNARSFSGTTDLVDAGDPVSGVFDFGAGQDFSFSFWLKRVASSTSEFVFAKGAGGTGDVGYSFALESGDAMKLQLSKTGEGVRLGIYGANITDTNWHHVAVTLSRASLAAIYLDGVLTGTGDISGYNVSLANAARHLTIGCSSSGSLCFPGTIDDVRLYNRALSADEVYGIYRTSSPVCSTPSGYEGDVLYNKGTNHVLQFCDNTSWRPLGPVPGAGGSGCINPVHPEGDMIYSDSGAGSGVMQYCDGTNWIKMGGPNLPTSGLVAYWKLDEGSGTTVADSSGNGNNGALTGSPPWVSNGKIGGALTMNGYATVPDASSLALNTFTISMWVNSTSLPGWLLEKYNGTSGYWFYYDGAAHTWNCGFGTGGVGYAQIPPLNQWYQVACTYDGSFLTFYINGQSVTTNAGSGTAATGGPLWLGWSQYGVGSPNTTLDDVRIYNRALSAAEVWQLYNGT